MDKLKMHSQNLIERNIALIAEFFPNCVTESNSKDGLFKQQIDFDLLRQELSSSIVEGPQERYHLNWPGKRDAILASNTPVLKTLRPYREESLNFDTTENLFIEGDNLEALKLLQETYLNKVKLIYFDPPYNTGNDFVYRDAFDLSLESYLGSSNQTDNLGSRLVANTESNGRFHSDWLTMLYPRLKLARNLLQDDGIVLISIDDNEVHNLRKLCDEIFGEGGFLAEFVWKCRQFTDARSGDKISTDHEYLVCYSRSDVASFRGNTRDESKYKNPDRDPRGPWMSRSILGLATRDQRPNLHYAICDPSTGLQFSPPENTGWRYGKERMTKLIDEGCILFPTSAEGRPREKKFREDLESEFTSFPTIIDGIHTSHGTGEVRGLFGLQVFDFPKPIDLIRKFLEQVLCSDDTVIDAFAGSCTTAHAVMELNASDEGKRRYIMIQTNEPISESSNARKEGFSSIAELGRERIRRAGKKVLSENATTAPNLDVGFRVLKLDTSNMKDVYYQPDATEQSDLFSLVENIKQDRTSEDLLFQVLLDWGVDLCLSIASESISGHEVFFVDGNALAACFDNDLCEETIKGIAIRKPLRAVFRDASFASDSAKINIEQVFKFHSPSTDLKCI